jgi:hypothetical protein
MSLYTHYPSIRQLVHPSIARLSDVQIEDLFESASISAEDLESFLGTLGNIGRRITNVLPQVLPGVIKGLLPVRHWDPGEHLLVEPSVVLVGP